MKIKDERYDQEHRHLEQNYGFKTCKMSDYKAACVRVEITGDKLDP